MCVCIYVSLHHHIIIHTLSVYLPTYNRCLFVYRHVQYICTYVCIYVSASSYIGSMQHLDDFNFLPLCLLMTSMYVGMYVIYRMMMMIIIIHVSSSYSLRFLLCLDIILRGEGGETGLCVGR